MPRHGPVTNRRHDPGRDADRWGVDIIFGLPGDGINGIVEALRTRQDRIRFIVARHEEAAAFMACAYAKWTGRLGCCLATTGPGGVHLLNGLYDAKFDRAPVLAITGLPYHDLMQTSTQQDIDHGRLFQDVAEHSTTITGAAQVAQATTLACRTALARRGVAHLAIPVDMQEQEVEDDKPSPRNKAGATRAFAPARATPVQDDVARAAEILNAGAQDCDSRRAGRVGCAAGAAADRRTARRADRQGAARQGDPAGRPSATSPAASATSARGPRSRCSPSATRC